MIIVMILIAIAAFQHEAALLSQFFSAHNLLEPIGDG
jgi:hypothetical protein